MVPEAKHTRRKGLVAVFTGNGKGKTTAALGLLVRAAGHNHRICMIQFIKGSWKCGEQTSVKTLNNVELHTMGKGFTWKSDNIDEDIKLARNAWTFAREKINSGRYDLIILDELTYLVKYNMVSEQDIVACLQEKPDFTHVVITGRDASEQLIATADLVTEMNNVKHPYTKGVKAQAGFEF